MASIKDAYLLTGQQEAIRRVRMAQERANAVIDVTNGIDVPPVAPHNGIGNNMGGSYHGFQGNQNSRNSGQNNFFNRPTNTAPHNNGPVGGIASTISQWLGSGGNKSDNEASSQGEKPPGGRGIGDLFTSKSLGGIGESLNSVLSSVSSPVSDILDKFDIDGEKLIIILIMWVIFNERGDKTLLMALGYLLI